MDINKEKINMIDRAILYNKAFPNFPPLVFTDRWVYGIWMLGNDYRNKTTYYGAYPPTYLKRIISMFPDSEEVLHLFSGSLDKSVKGIRLDINPDLKPDIIGDASKLSEIFEPKRFDLILADPPYSNDDAKRYGTPLIKRNIVVSECFKVLKPEGYLIWLDQVLPMYRKDELKLVGTIGIIRSTNHRFRVVSIFQKQLDTVEVSNT